jgi:hypothetical protein
VRPLDMLADSGRAPVWRDELLASRLIEQI